MDFPFDIYRDFQIKKNRFEFFIYNAILLLIVSIFFSLLIFLFPSKSIVFLVLFFLSLIILSAVQLKKKRDSSHLISKEDVIIGLDITYQKIQAPIYNWDLLDQSDRESWFILYKQNVKNLEKQFIKKQIIPISFVTFLLAAFIGFCFLNASHLLGVFHKLSHLILGHSSSASLVVVQGGFEENGGQNIFPLKKDPQIVKLITPNLIRIQLDASLVTKNGSIILIDKKNPDKIFQSFQIKEPSLKEKKVFFDMAISKSVSIKIPDIFSDAVLWEVEIDKLPVPEVFLSTDVNLKESWQDDQELPLEIKVHAVNPLQTIKIIIKNGTKESKELVHTMGQEPILSLSTSYRLLLEPYIDSDQSQLDIFAEATDRALPVPLVGLSDPLRIETISAYGRYRKILQSLYQIKNQLDVAIEKRNPKLEVSILETMKSALFQADQTPFFDGLDRLDLTKLHYALEDNQSFFSMQKIYEISDKLSLFLEEHEILDDRERDRDFFIAMRNLSRLLESRAQLETKASSYAIDRMLTFLDQRYKRWHQRVAHLIDKNLVPSWKKISEDKPFHKTLQQIEGAPLEQNKQLQKTLVSLSQLTVQYRSWLEELESAEDKSRIQKEEEKRQGMANAKDVLAQIQKQQNAISASLDKAASQNFSVLKDMWPSVRMKENSNIEMTTRLERQMKELSPASAARLTAALEAMKSTKEEGSEDRFVKAESYSDLASRLLRQAEESAKSQKNQKQQPRKRRRVSADQYYGQSVHGGDVDINREYRVDKKYREDILKEVGEENVSDDEHKLILDQYLRKVVR